MMYFLMAVAAHDNQIVHVYKIIVLQQLFTQRVGIAVVCRF